MTNVPDLERDEVTAAQLAVDPQVEESELPHPTFHLEPNAQCPGVLELERRLLSDDLALVSRLAMSGIASGSHDGLPSS
jgi:hypothetical protein